MSFWIHRLLLLAVIFFGAALGFAGGASKKVLIIGIDGTMVDALAVAKTPHLDQLKANGCFSDRAITHPVTHSAPCWSSMFTGVWGDKHGVNDPNNSFAGNRFDRYPNFLQRLETARPSLNTIAFLRWAPLATALAGADRVQSFGSDDSITIATCQQLTNANPDVFYTILLDVDSAGHSYGWGPTVSNYLKAIETADARVGQMMQALTNRPTYAQEDWVIIVLSDHGQHDSTLEKSRLTFHIVSGATTARGVIYPSPSIVDVCATVLTHMEMPIDPAWDLDARPEGLFPRLTRFGANLIFNGDAEANSGTNNYTPNRGIAWWWDWGPMTLGDYGANTNFPTLDSPGPPERGRRFFLGGSTNSTISQTIDIADIAEAIDQAGVDYVLSGWLGGKGVENDGMQFSALFLDGQGALLASNTIGPVTATERNNVTGLLECHTTGSLPRLARRVEFVLTSITAIGMGDASADNLSFVLSPRAETRPIIRRLNAVQGRWQVELDGQVGRYYALERSLDFRQWTSTGQDVFCLNSPVVLVDTNGPEDRVFFRVRRVQ